MTQQQAAQSSLLYDETFETPKGSVRVAVDFSRILDDVQGYTDKLMLARSIPFDTDNLSPADPMVIIASAGMPWITDSMEVVNTARRHYDLHAGKARMDAVVLASTRLNPAYAFDPDPYPEIEQGDEWDFSLPEPKKNLLNPVERRLKQIYDILTSDAEVVARFYAAMQTVFVEAQRRQQATDADGFRAGRSGGAVPKKAKS